MRIRNWQETQIGSQLDVIDVTVGKKPDAQENGFWRFYNVEVDTSYDVYILAYPSQLSTPSTNFITVQTTTETIPNEPGSLVADNSPIAPPQLASASLELSSDTTKKYIDFGDNYFGVAPDAVDQVSDRNYMTYILSYFPDGEPTETETESDPDNDGLNNKIEQLLNTDPGTTNSTPVPLIAVGDTGSGTSGNADDNVILIEYYLNLFLIFLRLGLYRLT